MSCVCSKATLFCGMVNFTTGLTAWVKKSWSSVFLIVRIICVGVVGNFVVGVRVRLTTIIFVALSVLFVLLWVWFFPRLS